MKKRLIGTLLLGALFVSSTSMFVSCKDYDDDINNVSDRVTVLEAAKVDLENKIATLRADLEANYATKVALANEVAKLNESIDAETLRAKQAELDEYNRAVAAEAALSARIQTAQDGVDMLDALIGGDISKSANFADCKTYKEALEKTWSKIETVESGLGKRLTQLETDLDLDNAQSKIRVYLATLENQIKALEDYHAALEADGGVATKNYVGNEIAAAEGRAHLDAVEQAATAELNANNFTKGYTFSQNQITEKIQEALNAAAADAQTKADKALADAKAYTDGYAYSKETTLNLIQTAKEAAFKEAKDKAAAAQAAAEAYADKRKTEAITAANDTANKARIAAEAAAKAYSDELMAQALAHANDTANKARSAAEAYADQQIAIAKSEAIAEAAKLDEKVLSDANAYTDTEIQKLKDNELKALSDRITALSDKLNVLDMISKQLRSLVFIPQGYIDGVEGLKVLYLYYWKFNNLKLPNGSADPNQNWTVLGGANKGWNTKEVKYTETVDITKTGKSREQDHDRYYSRNYNVNERLLDFTAKYHMNPTSADPSLIKSVGTVNADKWFEKTRTATAADCGFFVRGYKAANGILNVDYGMTDRTKVKTGNEITVFATTVQYGDTTITSDYATLMNVFVDSLVLSHAPKNVAPSLRVKGTAAVTKDTKAAVKNSHCGYCALADANNGYGRDSLHLFATITEAAGSTVTESTAEKTDDKFAPQDSVAYNDRTGINLANLVETHYTDKTDHKHKHLTDISTYGLKYKFELTKLIYGNNLTSESAHAVIVFKDAQGNVVEESKAEEVGATPYLIPWMPTDESREGVQQAYDPTRAATCQTKQLVGRTPLVRVSLVDDSGNVLDYGYIRFLIVDNDTEPGPGAPNPYRRFISFNAPDWSASKPWCGDWNTTGYDYDTKWIETELKLYALDGTMSHDYFINNYHIEFASGGAGALKQYNVGDINPDDANQAKFSVVAAANLRGTFTERPNAKPGESNTLKWSMTAAETKDAWVDGKATADATDKELSSDAVAVRYLYDPNNDGVSDNEYKDIYVVFYTGALTYTKGKEVVGTINWDGRKNPQYWYTTNTNTAGYNEIHANVFGVEDAKETQAITLKQTIQATFMGNKIAEAGNDQSAFITVANKDGKGTPAISGKDLTLSLEFIAGANKTFKGYNEDGAIKKIGTVIRDKKNGGKNRALMAYYVVSDNDQFDATVETLGDTIATLEYTDAGAQDINHMDVKFHNTKMAKELLNWRGHDELQNDFLTAYVAVKAKYGTCDVELTGDPINVRFLRPINVTSKNTAVVDAATTEIQQIDLLDLVNFTDWRNTAEKPNPFKTNYWFYYGIQKIEVPGVGNNGNLSINPNVKTNLGIEGVGNELSNTLKSVSQLVEFVYLAAGTTANPAVLDLGSAGNEKAPAANSYGLIQYTNLGSTVQEFDVKVPLKITYIWGELFTEATIKVHNTAGNARRK